MATQGPTMYQKRMALRRRTSNLDALTKQYQQQMAGVGKEYETAYSGYQAEVGKKQKAYEESMTAYGTQKSAYEKAISDYTQKYQTYSEAKQDYIKDPYKYERLQEVNLSRGRVRYVYNGQQMTGAQVEKMPNITMRPIGGRLTYGVTTKKEEPKFTDVEPTAPTVPTAPEIEKFNAAPFEEKKAQAETTYKRELGERKAGRQRAVSRKASRSMLQGS